jgi:hypothetical protein
MTFPAYVIERAGQFHLYDLSEPVVGADFVPAAQVSVPSGIGELHESVAHPRLEGLVCATQTELTRLARDGRVLWRVDLGPSAGERVNSRVSCGFSADGELVWVYLPDALMDRGPDRLLVVDEATGTTLATATLSTAGHGAAFHAHPDGSMVVEIGEGQDGVPIFACRLADETLSVKAFPWFDRVLIGFSPDGSQFMTVDHSSQKNVAFHSYPDGKKRHKLGLRAFGKQPKETAIEWAGGYLDANVAVVVLSGYNEKADEDWTRHYLVDPARGKVRGEWDMGTSDVYDIQPLGDGTWLRQSKDGPLERHAF